MKKFFFIVFILALVGGVVWYFSCVNNRYFSDVVSSDSGDLKIGVINVCGLSYCGNRDVTEAVLLKTADFNGIDVLALQEFPTLPAGADLSFAEEASQFFPYVSIKGECAILSRYPILEHKRVSFIDRSDQFSSVLISTGEKDFRLITMHLRTTGLYMIDNGRNIKGAGGYANMRQMMRENNDIRVVQAQSIFQEAVNSSEPVIVAGDCNSLPFSKVYRNIKGDRLYDSFLESGKGKGSTYRLMKDIIRIDYIFHDSSFNCVGAGILDEALSDHRMITATFNW